MSLTTTKRGLVSAPVMRQTAAAQQWKCASCLELLPAAFEIDHRVPLWNGGADAMENLQALCPNCHADKTQREAIQRRLEASRKDKIEAYDNRNDIAISQTHFRCAECHQERKQTTPHPVCWALERKFEPATAAQTTRRLEATLSEFAFRRVYNYD